MRNSPSQSVWKTWSSLEYRDLILSTHGDIGQTSPVLRFCLSFSSNYMINVRVFECIYLERSWRGAGVALGWKVSNPRVSNHHSFHRGGVLYCLNCDCAVVVLNLKVYSNIYIFEWSHWGFVQVRNCMALPSFRQTISNPFQSDHS